MGKVGLLKACKQSKRRKKEVKEEKLWFASNDDWMRKRETEREQVVSGVIKGQYTNKDCSHLL